MSRPRPDSRAPIDFEFDSLDNRPVDATSTRGAPTVIAFVDNVGLDEPSPSRFLS